MCRSLHCAYLLAHHTPAPGKGNPYGPSVGCLRGRPPILRLPEARAWRGVAKSGVCRRAYFSPPPPREDGARSSVVKTPGSVTRFPDGPQPPLAFTEYVPITTVVTLRRASPVDRNRPPLEAVSSQLRNSARGLRGVPVNLTDTRNPSRTMLDISSRVRVHVEHCRRRRMTWGFAMLLSSTHRPESRTP